MVDFTGPLVVSGITILVILALIGPEKRKSPIVVVPMVLGVPLVVLGLYLFVMTGIQG
jgi:hypothetical protein